MEKTISTGRVPQRTAREGVDEVVAERSQRAVLSLVAGAVVVLVALMVGFAISSRAEDPAAGPTGAPLVEMELLDFVPATVTVPAGSVRLDLRNGDAIPHTFTVDALGVDTILGSGERTSLRFEAEPGTYDIICTIPGHLEGGMRGLLRVE